MRILAIDPGTTESALVEIEDGRVLSHGKSENRHALEIVRNTLESRIVIEMVACYGMPVGAEVFTTVLWIGQFMEASPLPVDLLTRVDVKKHLCHKVVGVNDAVIRQRLIDKFGPGKEKAIGNKKSPGPLFGIKGDEWAALALGVTFAEMNAPRVKRTIRDMPPRTVPYDPELKSDWD